MPSKKSVYIIIPFSIILFSLFSCTKKSVTKYDCTGIAPTYTKDIKPILDGNCIGSGCHSGSHPERGIDLSTYNGAKSAASNNNFLGSIEHLSGYEFMPQNASKIDDSSIQKISCWIDNETIQ